MMLKASGYILATWKIPAKPHSMLPVNNRKGGLLGVSLAMKTYPILFLVPATDRKLVVNQVR